MKQLRKLKEKKVELKQKAELYMVENEKIEVVKLLHFLNQKTEKNYLEKEGVFYYASGISELPAANMIILEKSFTLKAAIELSDKKISSLEELNEAWRYIRYLSTNSVSDKHVDIAISTIKAHSELKKKEYPSNKYFDIAELVFNSNLKIQPDVTNG